ncbi:MAG: hypothetical protein WBI36_07040, partial [Erysipelotrichaceae bacterium]
KKVIEINDKDYLYDEQILSKVSNDKMVRYIIKNNKAAQTIVERLIQENRTINYYGPLTIEDKIKQI